MIPMRMTVPLLSDSITKNRNIYDIKKVVDEFNERSNRMLGIIGEDFHNGYNLNMPPERFTSIMPENISHIVSKINVEETDDGCKLTSDITISTPIVKYMTEGYKPIFGIRAIGNKDDISTARIITVDLIKLEKENDENEK